MDCNERGSVRKAQVLDLLEVLVAHTMLLQGMLIQGQDLPFLWPCPPMPAVPVLSYPVPQQHGYRLAFSWRTFSGDN